MWVLGMVGHHKVFRLHFLICFSVVVQNWYKSKKDLRFPKLTHKHLNELVGKIMSKDSLGLLWRFLN